MFSVAFEFKTEKEMQQAAKQLWDKHGVTGELEMFPTPEGNFRLHIYSEKQIRDSVLEKLPGKRVKAKGSYGSALPKEVVADND